MAAPKGRVIAVGRRPTFAGTIRYGAICCKRRFFDLADVVWSDRYPDFDASQNLSIERLAEVAEWAEEMRRTSQVRAFVDVLPLTMGNGSNDDPSTWIPVEFLRPGVFMSLVHGARGFWYFGDPAPMNFSPSRDYYASLAPLSAEISELSNVIDASAVELGHAIATTRLGGDFYPLAYQRFGNEVSLSDRVSTVYRESTDRRVLLSVNETTPGPGWAGLRKRGDATSFGGQRALRMECRNRCNPRVSHGAAETRTNREDLLGGTA